MTMGLPQWASEAFSIAKDVVMPDIPAWERVLSGDGDLMDFVSVATDVVSVIPGGALLKGAGKVGLAAAKHGDEVKALSKWNKDPLYHGMSNTLQGNKIMPASKGFAGANAKTHTDGLVTQEPWVRTSDMQGGMFNPRSPAALSMIKKGKPTGPIVHKDYAFSTPAVNYARDFATKHTSGPDPKILRVLPRSPANKQLVRSSPGAQHYNSVEVLSKRGLRVIGKEDGKLGPGWLATDFSAAKLKTEVAWLKENATWALPSWAAAETVDAATR